MARTATAGELVRQARVAAGLSQVELGVCAGVTQSVISAYESGHREPSLPMLQRLVEAAGLTLNISLTDRRPRFRGPVGRKVEANRVAIIAALERHGFFHPRVFGSVARNEDRSDSDVDLLVEFPKKVSLFSLGRVQNELEDIIGSPVDVVAERDLKDSVRETIDSELVTL